MAVNVSACAAPRRAENAFFINGKDIEVTPSLQRELREPWSGSGATGPFKTSLPEADVQWALDFISISELVRKPSCKQLKLLLTERRDNKDDTFQGRVIRSSIFDEQWTIDACGENHIYRVSTKQGHQNYQSMRLKNKLSKPALKRATKLAAPWLYVGTYENHIFP